MIAPMTGGKKVCVIGGAGYVGSRLVPELIDRGHDVTVVDQLWFGNHLDSSVSLVQEDVLKLKEDFFRGFDTVFFLAGLASDPMAEFSASFNFISNVAAPAYAAYASRRGGVRRFIFADSCSVYGDAGGRICDEDAPLTISYPYGVSKVQANGALMHLADGDFSVIALRKGTVSGWSPRMRFDLLVNAMYKSAWLDKKITVSNPKIMRPLLAIEDAVAAYMCALEAPAALSGTFNVASVNVTVGEVGRLVQEHFKKVHGANVDLDVHNNPDLRDYSADCSRGKKALLFEPHGSVASVLAGLDEHYGASFDYTLDEYYNIRVFKSIFDAKTNRPA